ncbi:unnamed protein product [Trichogramma brassicae]|uniref:Uncharacterized protein n=1 Tax=Trichogramma brassicae TaxID=86971 RepID=A0A6H5I4T5_9HYME|nr:unnamed protein product [Trichogramma brassicae]
MNYTRHTRARCSGKYRYKYTAYTRTPTRRTRHTTTMQLQQQQQQQQQQRQRQRQQRHEGTMCRPRRGSKLHYQPRRAAAARFKFLIVIASAGLIYLHRARTVSHRPLSTSTSVGANIAPTPFQDYVKLQIAYLLWPLYRIIMPRRGAAELRTRAIMLFFFFFFALAFNIRRERSIHRQPTIHADARAVIALNIIRIIRALHRCLLLPGHHTYHSHYCRNTSYAAHTDTVSSSIKPDISTICTPKKINEYYDTHNPSERSI